MRSVVLRSLAGMVGLFALLQLLPFRISNGPVTQEPAWDSPQTRALAVAACFDCHSNQTRKPWYANVAPVSWWLKSHVDDGRAALNFSEWDKPQRTRNILDTIQNGSMPPSYYTWLGLHADAKLTAAQKAELVQGLTATLGAAALQGRGGG
jgi:hypothetical protein